MNDAQLVAAQVRAACGDCRRIVIVGGPGTGKTTLGASLAEGFGVEHRRTDDLVDSGLDWSGVSDAVATMLSDDGDWVLEGAAAVRGLRKWLERNEGHPGFVVVRLDHPVRELTPRQESMGKGVTTVWREVAAEVARRGVRVVADQPRAPMMPGMSRPSRGRTLR